MRQWGFFFDQSRCTGCYTCQVACQDWHDLPVPVKWMKVEMIEEGKYPHPFLAYLVLPCMHCRKPACLAACPAGAIAKTGKDGVVTVDGDKCVGRDECGALCLKACPWKAPQFAAPPNAKMQKCDLCADRLEAGRAPICVEACPMFALEAGPLDELAEKFGSEPEARGFKGSEKLGPSILFKARKNQPGRP